MEVDCYGPGMDENILTALDYLDCRGCTRTVAGSGTTYYVAATGCACIACSGGEGGGCSYTGSVSSPAPWVETCQPQPLSMSIPSFTGTYSSRWSNVVWTATLGSPATNLPAASASVHVYIGGTNVDAFVAVSQTASTLRINFAGLNDHSVYDSPEKVTDGMLIVWDSALGQTGSFTEAIGFNLCGGSYHIRSWVVGEAAMTLSLLPTGPGAQCGILDGIILINQLLSPGAPSSVSQIAPGRNVEVILDLAADGGPASSLLYVTNSTVITGVTTNTGDLVTALEPSIEGNLVIWRLGNVGGFTNGQLAFRLQAACTPDVLELLRASLRYNSRCEQDISPQMRTNLSTTVSVPIQTANLVGAVSPSLIPLNTTGFDFTIDVFNSKAAPAHNFFIEVQVPTNITLVSASIPWSEVLPLNALSNTYRWTFQSNAAPAGLESMLADNDDDGIVDDLLYNGMVSISVTGAVSSCSTLALAVLSGHGCLGVACQTVGPLPVVLENFTGRAVARLDFPSQLPLCGTGPVTYTLRNSGQSDIYHFNPSFYLPEGVSFVPGSATARTNGGADSAITDPAGLGTVPDPFHWSEAQIPLLSSVPGGQDVIVTFQVAAACDALYGSGNGGAYASFVDMCAGTNLTALEVSAISIAAPSLEISKAMLDPAGRADGVAVPGETNMFRIRIQHSLQSDGPAYMLELTDTLPSASFVYIGSSTPPDSTNGSVLTWSNATLMALAGGAPYALTSPAISLVVTGYWATNCTSPVVNSTDLSYGCADAACLSASASASVVLVPRPVLLSTVDQLLLDSCGGTYTVSLRNNGGLMKGIILTNFAPAGYLVASARVTGALSNAIGESAPLTLGGSPAGRYAILDLTSTNTTNVQDPLDSDRDPLSLDLAETETATVIFTLVTDGSALDCTANPNDLDFADPHPARPVPVTTTNVVRYTDFCDAPSTLSGTVTSLPDSAMPVVNLSPNSLIVTNGQTQDFTVSLRNDGDRGNASGLLSRLQFGAGWTDIIVLGVANNTAGGSLNTGSLPIAIETNGLNGVLLDLGQVVLEPMETVTYSLRATVRADGHSLLVTAEITGQCGQTSPGACASFLPASPLALTMPAAAEGSVLPISNSTLYSYDQDSLNGVGFTLSKTVRYSSEPAPGGSNRVARIGEDLTYRIRAEFFNAPFTNVVIHESLPPNLAYGTPVDAGSTTNWSYDPLTGDFTLPSPLTTNTLFIVDFPVTVTNGFTNQLGVAFTNTVSATFTTAITNLPDPASTFVTEIEPTLFVNTLVGTNTTDFSPAVSDLEAGDTVYFLVTVSNITGTTAYDLWLSNSLPSDFINAALVSATPAGNVYTNGVLASGPLDPTLFSITSGTLLVTGTNTFSFETNSAILIILSAQLDYAVNPSDVFYDTTTIRWASMPGDAPQKRSGGSLTPDSGVNSSTNDAILNNYAATSDPSLSTVIPAAFAKNIVGTALSTPGNDSGQATLGEIVTYRLTATIPQGTALNMQVVDTLQDGLAFIDVTAVSLSPNVSISNPFGTLPSTNPPNVTVAPPGRLVSFNLGDVSNANIDGSPGSVTITYRAVVLDEMGNQAGTTLTNSAVFSCATCATTNAFAPAITVVEPALGVRELVSTNASTYDTAVSGIQAGQPVYFQVTITNGTGTTAYDLWLSNALPARFHQGTVVSVTPAGNVWTNGIAATGSLETGLFEFTGTVLGVATTNLIAMETGSSLVVVFAAEAGYTATPNERFTNDTTIRWSSYPASPTNLSAYNAAAMARTGGTNTPLPDVNYSTNNAVLDNYAATSGTVLATDKPTVFAKALFQTSLTTPGNANNQAAVGELVTYTVTATIPQGTAPGMQIIDTLQAGLAFVDVTDVTVSPNVNLEHEIGLGSNAANVSVAPPGRVITFSPGDVVNTNSDGSVSTIVITYRAVVLNEMDNQAGTTLTNAAVFSCTTCATTNAYAPAITVVEPALGVRELVSTNASTYGASVSGIQAGQPVYFQVTITNGTWTTAYDLWLSNALPAGFHQGSVVSVTSAGNVWTNGIAATGALETGLFEFTGSLLGVATTNLIALETNSSLVIVFAAEAVYAVTPNERFTNDTTIRWSSYPASPTNLSAYNAAAMARTGGTNTPLPDVNYSTNSVVLDNYAATSGTVLATDKPTVFAKALFQTSLTTPGNANNQASVGELVTYTVTATIPQGTAPGMQIIDTLQAGLAFVDVTDVTVSPNVTLAQPIGVGSNAANVSVAPPGRVITFSPGDVVNTNSDGSVSTIVITYRAVVLNEMDNQAGTTLTNAAVFSCTTCATTNAYAPAITVVEPALGVRELVSTNASTYGASVSGIQAGQPVYFQVTITNGTWTTAYDLWLSNALPAGFHQGSVVSVTSAGNVWTNGIAATGALETGLFEFTGSLLGVATTNLIALETNSSLVIVFAAEAVYAVTPNERFTNDTTIRWSSYPASPTNLSAYNAAAMARTGGTNTPLPDVNYSTNSVVLDNYAATSGTVLATDKPTVFAKALFQTSLTTPGNANNQASVGELVTYTVTATIPQGTAPGMQIIDTLQAGLAFVDVTDVTVSPNVTLAQPIGLGSNAANVSVAPPGRVITFSPGDVVNTNSDGSVSTIVITYRAVVLNEMDNQAGTTLTNAAVFSCTTCATTNAYAPAITVVEPALGVRELVSTNASTYGVAVSGIQAGQPVYFQVTITNGTWTTAYDLWLSNALPAGFHQGTVVSVTSAGNVWTNGIAASGALETGLFEFTGSLLGVATTNLIALETNSSLVIVFAAEAVYAVTPNERFTNDTTIRWSSYPASPTNLSAYNAAAMARTGGTNTPLPDINYSTNSVVLDNYAATSGTVLATDKPTVFAKALFQTSLTTPGNANNQASVGELVTYTVTATIPQGTAPGMQIIDTLQAGLAFVDVTDVTVSPNVTLAQPIGVGSNAANVSVAPPGRVITFSPGDVVNTNSDGSVSTIVITYRAVVLNEMDNQAGTTLTNAAVFSCTTCATTNAYAPAITVVEPALGVRELVSTNASTYGASVSGIQAGQPVYFQVTITNGTGTTAYDLWLSNALPARFHQGTVVSVTPAGNVWTNGIAATGSLETGLFEFTGTILGVATTNLIAMETGSSLVVVFAAEAGYTATPNERFTNDTTIRWSSYPASPTNLSAYNAAAMARTGGTNTPLPDVNYSTNNAVLDNYAATSGTVLATDKPTVFAKALFQTSLTTPGNANNQAAVGELVTYTVTATIPQGTAPGMQIIDTLQAGLAFVDVTDVTVSPNVNLEHEIGLGSNAANVTVAPPGRVITFSPGDVVNTNSDGSISTIVITYRAVVLDEMGNQAGTTLTNSAVFSCTTCATTNAYAAAITVVEPALGVRELVSTNASTYDTAVSGIQAGQPVYFQVTITNGTGTTAYDLWLSNALPARFHQGTVVSVTPAGNVWTNGIAATGSLETGLFEFTGTVLGVATTNLIAMETGSSLVVVFAAEAGYTATPNERFTNDTTIRWSSYPASPTNLSAYNAAAMARTGGTNTPPPDVNYSTNNAVLDNYAATSGTVLATDKPTVFAKALFQTSLTTPGNANNQASVGELVTYTVTATIPQGTAPGMQIIDTLQAGLAFVDVTDVTVSPNVNLEHEIGLGSNAANVTVAPPGRVITFSPGDVVNTNSDGSVSTIVITYRAVVLDEMGNQAGTTLTNSAVFSCATCATTNAYAPAITVVEPALGVRELVSTNASTYDTAVSGIQAGQPVYFQVAITNGTGTTAYDLWLSNALPARFHQGTVVSVTPAGNVWTNGIAATGSLETGLFEFTGTVLGVATTNLIAMETGSSLVVVFAAEAVYTATPNERFTNDTTIRWSSYPASPTNLSAYNAAAMARTGGTNTPLPDVNYSTNNAVLDNYAATSGTVLATDKPTVFAKALFQTSLTTPGNANNQAAVGELVTYTVTATIPQGTAPGMQIIDTLQAGLAFVDVTDVTVSPNVNLEHEIGLGSNAANVTVAPPGRVITFSPGDVVNTNSDGSISTIVITYRAVVLDEMGNQAGTTLTNSAVFSCATCATTNAYAPAITVVEPALGVRELVSTNASTYDTAVSGIQAGQPVYFQVTITNGTGTTAYDLWLSNALPARFHQGTVVSVTPAGNVWTNGIAATGSLETGLFEFTGTILGVATTNLIAMETGSSLVVVFAAEAVYTATPNERFTNDTTIRWSSYPASPTNLSAYNAAAMARTGGTNTPPPDVNYSTNSAVLDNYAATSGTVLATDKPTVFAKALFQTSLTTPGNANNQASVGELVTYTVTATIPQGTAPGMQIIDTLQAGLAFVDVTDVTVSPNVNLEHEIGLGSNAANVTVAPPGRVITFSPGDVVNTNSDGSVSTIVITYRAVVLDEMGNQTGTTLTNSAVFSCATCATTNAFAPAITVVEPALGVRELVSTNASTYDTAVSGIQAGQPVYFQVTITNGTGTTAYDLWLSNALPARFHQGNRGVRDARGQCLDQRHRRHRVA